LLNSINIAQDMRDHKCEGIYLSLWRFYKSYVTCTITLFSESREWK